MTAADIAAQLGPWLVRIGLFLAAIIVCLAIAGLAQDAFTALQRWWRGDDDG